MPLELHPMLPSDALSWQRIKEAGFPTHRLIYTRPIDDTVLRAAAAAKRREIGSSGMWHFKVVDTSLSPGADDAPDNGGRSIAIAVWSVQNTTTSTSTSTASAAEEESSTTTGPTLLRNPPPGLRLDALRDMLAPLRAAQREIMGSCEKYLKLEMLVTVPEQQGRGAGGMLLAWGLRMADQEGLAIYLDSTVVGRGLYERRV